MHDLRKNIRWVGRMTLTSLLLLYLAFRTKQFLCDFPLQTQWMAIAKGKDGWNGYKPLLVHASIHGIGTTVIVLLFCPALFWLGAVDIIVHGCIDRLKALITKHYMWTANHTKFWWALGLDQEAHNLTHLVYICLIVLTAGGISVN